MKKLDMIDRHLLGELSENGRQEVAILARKLTLGRDRVMYRINKFVESGVVKSFTTLINPAALGITLFKTYYRLRSDRRRIPKLLQFLEKHPRIFWLAECAGQWDLVVVVFGYNSKEFSTIQDDMLRRFSDCFLDSSFYAVTDAWYFGRGYFAGRTHEQVYVGHDDPIVEVDDLDLRLLRILAKDARITLTSLSQNAKTSPPTARARLERLEKLGVVAYYRAELNLSKIERLYYKAQLFFSTYDPWRESELRAFCKNEPDILFLIKQIGHCRMEIELEVESAESYHNIIDRLRDRFADYIDRVETVIIRKQRLRGVPLEYRSGKRASNAIIASPAAKRSKG